MLRFHGVLAPNSALRPLVVPKPATPAAPLQLPLFEQPAGSTRAAIADAEPTEPRYKGRHPWAQLLRHVFAADVSLCVHCQGRMHLHELATTPDAIARAMAHAGLGPRPPPALPSPAHSLQLSLPLR